MKKNVMAAVLGILSLTACENNKTASGALIGGAVGAGTGAIINGGQGALVGGAIGLVAGGAIGAVLDAQDREKMQKQNPKTLDKIDNGEQLSIPDIIQMSDAGLSDKVINSQIDASNSVFHLSSSDIIYLKNEGVSQKVINHMIETGK